MNGKLFTFITLSFSSVSKIVINILKYLDSMLFIQNDINYRSSTDK